MDNHEQEKEIKREQPHVPPELPTDPEHLEHDKRQMANMIPAVVIAAGVVFLVIALIVIL